MSSINIVFEVSDCFPSNHPFDTSVMDAAVATIFVSYNTVVGTTLGVRKPAISHGAETAIRVWNGKRNAAVGVARRRAKAAQDLVSRFQQSRRSCQELS